VNENEARSLWGVGIYGIPLAARLTRVSSWRIRRWLCGYRFDTAHGEHQSPPVWRGDLPVLGGAHALSFRDLIEVRFVDAFLRQGVRWTEIRAAERIGAGLFRTTHPFATNRFRADGRKLFAALGQTGNAQLLHVTRSQAVFTEIISPYLKGIEFADGGDAARWWPLADSRRIVIDPERSFGKPIVAREGVPTHVIATAHASGQALADVAHWYRVSLASVRAAVRYEQQLRAA